MNWVHCVFLGVATVQPYLPSVGPAPLRFADPQPPRIVSRPLTPLPQDTMTNLTIELPLPVTATITTLVHSATSVPIPALPPTVEPQPEMRPEPPRPPLVTPEMFLELFRRSAGQHGGPVIGMPFYFVPPRVEPSSPSTAKYRSD
jgi:hypothetical protein